jgi:hypothetical protein
MLQSMERTVATEARVEMGATDQAALEVMAVMARMPGMAGTHTFSRATGVPLWSPVGMVDLVAMAAMEASAVGETAEMAGMAGIRAHPAAQLDRILASLQMMDPQVIRVSVGSRQVVVRTVRTDLMECDSVESSSD